jgi:hypothetical protein
MYVLPNILIGYDETSLVTPSVYESHQCLSFLPFNSCQSLRNPVAKHIWDVPS